MSIPQPRDFSHSGSPVIDSLLQNGMEDSSVSCHALGKLPPSMLGDNVHEKRNQGYIHTMAWNSLITVAHDASSSTGKKGCRVGDRSRNIARMDECTEETSTQIRGSS